MELKFFYRPGCPYCRQAEELLTELFAERPEFKTIPLRRVNENAEAALAEQYDYWYVPTFFLGDEKLYEADARDGEKAVREKLTRVLETALERK
jgi:glutaredoxin